jgi:uncharacterized protein YqeY
MLLKTLRDDQLAARKSRDAVASGLLTALVGEAAMIGKTDGDRETTDAEVMALITKFLKNAEITQKALVERGEPTSIAQGEREIAILKGYRPSQMSEDDLRTAIEGFKAQNPDAKMGDVMGFLKANHGGLYDGKLASQVTKAVLG